MRSSKVPWQDCYTGQFLGVTREETKQLAATFLDVRLLAGMSQAQGPAPLAPPQVAVPRQGGGSVVGGLGVSSPWSDEPLIQLLPLGGFTRTTSSRAESRQLLRASPLGSSHVI